VLIWPRDTDYHMTVCIDLTTRHRSLHGGMYWSDHETQIITWRYVLIWPRDTDQHMAICIDLTTRHRSPHDGMCWSDHETQTTTWRYVLIWPRDTDHYMAVCVDLTTRHRSLHGGMCWSDHETQITTWRYVLIWPRDTDHHMTVCTDLSVSHLGVLQARSDWPVGRNGITLLTKYTRSTQTRTHSKITGNIKISRYLYYIYYYLIECFIHFLNTTPLIV